MTDILNNRYIKMYLYNYYIDKGSFTNLSKNAPAIYKQLLARKKETNNDNLTLNQWLEITLFKYRKGTLLDSSYLRYLYNHYEEQDTLVGAKIPKGFETRLKETAKENGVTLEEVKQLFDNNQIYPELMTQIKNRLDVRMYNNLLSVVVFNLVIDSNTTYSHISIDLLQNFNNIKHLRQYEPGLYTLLKSKIPVHGGSLTGNNEAPLKVEGTKYYGPNLNLQSIPTLYDDVLFSLKGYSTGVNITPSVRYALENIKKKSGNLNRIGIDGYGVIDELDKLTFNLGYSSIRELLEKEGYSFTPITADRVSFVPSEKGYEVFIQGYDEYQILLDERILEVLKRNNLDQTLEVATIPYKKRSFKCLVYVYEGKAQFAHSLLTKKDALNFKDNNSLNLTAENLG